MREIKLMTIKEFYLDNYPSDELGNEINENSTFVGLLWMLQTKRSVYDFLGISDTVIRERVFQELAKQLRLSYTTIYEMWLQS